MTRTLSLPIDSDERKNIPVLRGAIMYFPAAIAGVAGISKKGNDKHNPGEELHHARGKSMDHGDCIVRHLMDVQDMLAALGRQAEKYPHDGEDILHEANQLAWRALAFSQELHERFGAPLAPNARLPAPSAAGVFEELVHESYRKMQGGKGAPHMVKAQQEFHNLARGQMPLREADTSDHCSVKRCTLKRGHAGLCLTLSGNYVNHPGAPAGETYQIDHAAFLKG